MVSEKSVEIPWLYKNLKEGSVLDIGSEESSYIKKLVNEGRKVFQIDIRLSNNDLNTKKITGDIRKITPEEIGQFDNVLLISTLEHIGLNAYTYKADWKDSPILEQLRTFRHCMEFMKDDGVMPLTIPYGKYEHGGWFLVYEKNMIEEIKKGYLVVNETYFTLKKEPEARYVECRQEECPLVGADVVRGEGIRSTSVACLALMKEVKR